MLYLISKRASSVSCIKRNLISFPFDIKIYSVFPTENTSSRKQYCIMPISIFLACIMISICLWWMENIRMVTIYSKMCSVSQPFVEHQHLFEYGFFTAFRQFFLSFSLVFKYVLRSAQKIWFLGNPTSGSMNLPRVPITYSFLKNVYEECWQFHVHHKIFPI